MYRLPQSTLLHKYPRALIVTDGAKITLKKGEIMNITIIGSGNMAKGIGTRLISGGHALTFHARDAEKGQALAQELSASAQTGTAQAVALGSDIHDDIVVLALHFGEPIESVAKRYGAAFDGKTVVDISNPVSFPSFDWLIEPSLTSGAETVAQLLPRSKIVKAFNTQFATALVAGKIGGQSLDIFVAGDDQTAKDSVIEVIRTTDMRAIDAGPLAESRHLEGMERIFLKIQDQVDNSWSTALKIVG
jgi:predicted dinucleotide-binding enzyme